MINFFLYIFILMNALLMTTFLLFVLKLHRSEMIL